MFRDMNLGFLVLSIYTLSSLCSCTHSWHRAILVHIKNEDNYVLRVKEGINTAKSYLAIIAVPQQYTENTEGKSYSYKEYFEDYLNFEATQLWTNSTLLLSHHIDESEHSDIVIDSTTDDFYRLNPTKICTVEPSKYNMKIEETGWYAFYLESEDSRHEVIGHSGFPIYRIHFSRRCRQ